jgi:hypothetical protein
MNQIGIPPGAGEPLTSIKWRAAVKYRESLL